MHHVRGEVSEAAFVQVLNTTPIGDDEVARTCSAPKVTVVRWKKGEVLPGAYARKDMTRMIFSRERKLGQPVRTIDDVKVSMEQPAVTPDTPVASDEKQADAAVGGEHEI